MRIIALSVCLLFSLQVQASFLRKWSGSIRSTLFGQQAVSPPDVEDDATGSNRPPSETRSRENQDDNTTSSNSPLSETRETRQRMSCVDTRFGLRKKQPLNQPPSEAVPEDSVEFPFGEEAYGNDAFWYYPHRAYSRSQGAVRRPVPGGVSGEEDSADKFFEDMMKGAQPPVTQRVTQMVAPLHETRDLPVVPPIEASVQPVVRKPESQSNPDVERNIPNPTNEQHGQGSSLVSKSGQGSPNLQLNVNPIDLPVQDIVPGTPETLSPTSSDTLVIPETPTNKSERRLIPIDLSQRFNSVASPKNSLIKRLSSAGLGSYLQLISLVRDDLFPLIRAFCIIYSPLTDSVLYSSYPLTSLLEVYISLDHAGFALLSTVQRNPTEENISRALVPPPDTTIPTPPVVPVNANNSLGAPHIHDFEISGDYDSLNRPPLSYESEDLASSSGGDLSDQNTEEVLNR